MVVKIQMFTLNKPSLKNGLTNHKKCTFIVLKEGAETH